MVANNFIFDIAAGGWSSSNHVDDNGFGIAINRGGGYKIYFNSVKLTTNQGSGTTAACWISEFITTPATLDIRDNIFSSFQTTATRYPIYLDGAPNTIFGPINYNDYYDSLSNRIGYLGSAQNSLAAWQTASGEMPIPFRSIPGLLRQPIFTYCLFLPSTTSDFLSVLLLPILTATYVLPPRIWARMK